MLAYNAFRIAAALTRALPLRLSYALARLAGLCAYALWFGGRRRCTDNMRRVAGGNRREARRLARRSFEHYAMYLVDFLRLDAFTPSALAARVEFDDWDLLDRLREGGALFITVHLGNWDLGAAAVATHGVPLSVIADTFANESLDERVLGARRRLGMNIIRAERLGPGIMRALRDGEAVALLADVPDESDRSVQVNFFGEAISVSPGPARLAMRSKVTVVAAILPRIDRQSDRVRGELEEVRFTPSGDPADDARALTQAIFTSLERLVSRYPDQWYIFRHLWSADTRRGAA